MSARFGLTPAACRLAAITGVMVGVIYVMSPLTVWFAIAMTLLVRWAVKGLEGGERRWVMALLLVAIGLRVLAIAGLFAVTDHATTPFGVFFGDEEYYIRRSIWMRNLAVGLPLHSADLIYMFDETGLTSHLYVLAFVQVLGGPAPYGVHLLGTVFFLTAAVMLYRPIRVSFGRMPAALGLTAILFLPSLFAWSVSALKEPLFFLLTATSVALAAKLVRGPGWRGRLGAVAGIVLLAAALETIRTAGGMLSAIGVIGGLSMALFLRRPRLLLVTAMLVPLALGAVLNRPSIQLQAYNAVQAAARQHWGHVATPGYVYRLLDSRFYPDRSEISDMQFAEAGRFVVRAVERYVTVPLPWEMQSRAMLAYLPEQVLWYLIVLLAVPGVVVAMRRDLPMASLLVAHALVAAVTVALTSGNVGTLVRHRGLALPYLIWLSAVAFCELVRWADDRRQAGVPFVATGWGLNTHADSR